MKKILIIPLMLGFFLVSFTNNNNRPEARPGKSSTQQLSAPVLQPTLACTSYSIFNPHGPLGVTVLYSYVDCNGESQEGSVEPQQTVTVMAQPGTVKCPGGVVTETGTKVKTEPAK